MMVVQRISCLMLFGLMQQAFKASVVLQAVQPLQYVTWYSEAATGQSSSQRWRQVVTKADDGVKLSEYWRT